MYRKHPLGSLNIGFTKQRKKKFTSNVIHIKLKDKKMSNLLSIQIHQKREKSHQHLLKAVLKTKCKKTTLLGVNPPERQSYLQCECT